MTYSLVNQPFKGGLEKPKPYSPQENSSFVEQARKPVLEIRAKYEFKLTFGRILNTPLPL
ncbi:hypothetical protein [Microcoleus sp. K4-C2]|uniref:hypothetical protein n=1 Tax=Microcoleus sp. K4-C2 TaxID=2818792 RepID=UPI002FD1FCAF